MQKFTMEVSKKENGKYVKQGDVVIHYPLLSEMGLTVEPKENDSEGFPVYADDKVQFVFDAVLSAVKAQARNRLISGTATLKDGLSIAETVEALLESGGTGNKGEALAVVRDMLVAFKSYLAGTGKSQAVQDAVYNLAANKKSLMLQPADKKAKFSETYLAGFAEMLSEEQAARFERPLVALSEACEAGDALDDM